jgi:hypothetical protein
MNAVVCSFSLGHPIKILCPDCKRKFNQGDVLAMICDTEPFKILGVIGGISECCGNKVFMPRVFKDGRAVSTWCQHHELSLCDIYDIEPLINQLGLSDDVVDTLAAEIMLQVCLEN